MANNPNNIKLSACRVRWGGRDLGLTKGGVDVTIKTDTKQVTVHQFGNTPLNEYITGRHIMVKCPFAETDLDTLYSLTRLSGGTLNDNGTVAAGTLNFIENPGNGETVVINGHTFTFKTSPTVGVNEEVLIGTGGSNSEANREASVANLVAALNQCSDPNVLQGEYTAGTTSAPTQIAVTALTWASNSATATTATAHGLSVGDTFNMKGATPNAYNGTALVATTGTTGSTIIWSLPSNPGSATATGYVALPGISTTYAQLAINYFQSGVVGNSFTLAGSTVGADTVPNIQASGATLTGGTDATVRNVQLVTAVGTSLLTNALELVLHPSNVPDGDNSQDFVVPLASQSGNVTFAYKFDNERVFMVEFTGYPDPVTQIMCKYGST